MHVLGDVPCPFGVSVFGALRTDATARFDRKPDPAHIAFPVR